MMEDRRLNCSLLFGILAFQSSNLPDDIVYGSGLITDQAMIEFIKGYPDSAIKFYYQKKLDETDLTYEEKEIYRSWSRRGMSRQRLEKHIIEILNWEKMTKQKPHKLWHILRDRIYEIED